MGYSPFYVNHGYHPNNGRTIPRWSTNEAATTFANRMKGIHEDCQAALIKDKETMRWFYDKKKGDSQNYSEGDLVWVE